MSKAKSDSTKKRATRTTSNVFAMFTQTQIQEFKEAFSFIDSDKDGIINKNDLRATFDALGRIVNEDDLQSMLAEAPGPINFTMFLSIFGERIMGADKEDVIKSAFATFDQDGTGKFSEDSLRKSLQMWGEKLSDEEANTAFAEAKADRSGLIDINSFVKLITGSQEDEPQ